MKLNIEHLLKKYSLQVENIAQFGAHLGQEINILMNIANNKIYLFEPQKDIFEKLITKTSQHENIFAFNYGLGSEKSNKYLFVDLENEGQSASIFEPKEHLNIFPNINFDLENKKEIKIETFDSLNLRVDLICIDIQGAELDALKGAANSLQFTKCLTVEVSRDELYKNQPLLKEIDDFLNKKNFIRVKTKWAEGGKFLYGDAFYIKKSLISNFEIGKNIIKNLFLDKKYMAKLKFFIFRIKYKLKI